MTGRSHAWVVALIDGWDFRIRRVERDDDLITAITTMEDEFWHGYVVADREPPIEANALDVIKGRYPDVVRDAVQVPAQRFRELIAEHAAGKALEKSGKQQAKTAEAEMRSLIGDAGDALIGDEVVARLPLIQRGGYTVAPTSFRQLKIVKGK